MKRRMRFITWAKKDPDDETPIRYEFKGKDRVWRFTSDDEVSYSMLERIRNAWVESIEKVSTDQGEVWKAVLYED